MELLSKTNERLIEMICEAHYKRMFRYHSQNFSDDGNYLNEFLDIKKEILKRMEGGR